MKPLLLAALCLATTGAAAATASGRHWQITLESLACDAGASLVTVGASVRYLGPAGAVEAPEHRLVDEQGRAHAPRSLVWQRGSKLMAAWLSRGGLANLGASETAQLQFRFALGGDAGGLKLEFGDIPAFAVSQPGRKLCAGLLKPAQITAPRRPRSESGKATLRFYREAYPCQPSGGGEWRRVEAPHPPYLPEQLLVFGRGYLPGMRRIELPMGKVPAQGYAYSGPEELPAIEEAARKALAEDYPAWRASARHYVFNWGLQRSAAGNEIYSVGVYVLGPCR